MFNQTVPELIADPEGWGERLRLTGFTSDGELVLPVPSLDAPGPAFFQQFILIRSPSSLTSSLA